MRTKTWKVKRASQRSKGFFAFYFILSFSIGAIPKTKEEETEGEGQGQEPKKTKKVKEKGKKGKPKKGANTLPKGEIPKSKKDVKITKDANAASALDTAFGGQFDELDTTTAFTKEEVKVDL